MTMYITKGRRWEIMEEKVVKLRKEGMAKLAIARKLGCAENFVRAICKGRGV